MKCPNCNYEAGASKFCPECGYKLMQVVEPEKTVSDPVGSAEAAETAAAPEPISAEQNSGSEFVVNAKPVFSAKSPVGKVGKSKIVAIVAAALGVILFIGILSANANKMTASEKAAVQSVVESINKLPADVSLSNESEVSRLMTQYSGFSEKQKKKVRNYEKLEQASDSILELRIKEVVEAIDAIGTVSLSSGESIENAENLYQKLPDEAKKKVSNYQRVGEAEDRFYTLRAEEVDAAIKKIGTVTADSKPAITEAEKLHDDLPSGAKSKVTGYQTLKDAKTAYAKLMAGKVVSMIDSLGTITVNSKAKLDEIDKAYRQLTSEEKKLVTNYSKYQDALKKYDDAKKAAAEAERIREIKNSIRITKFNFTMNSVGGCTIWYRFQNVSGKTINYVTLTVTPYNAVGDEVKNHDRWDATYDAYYTGPVANGAYSRDDWRWENAWYNSTTDHIKCEEVKIDYADGTTLYVTGSDVDYLKAW